MLLFLLLYILGKPIKKNVSFIAACNPYKKTDESEKEIKKKKKSKPPGIEPGGVLDKNKIIKIKKITKQK